MNAFRQAAPALPHTAWIENWRRHLDPADLARRSVLAELHFVARLRSFQRYIRPEMWDILLEKTLSVIPAPIAAAFAERRGDEDRIIVLTGFADLVEFYMANGVLHAEIPNSLESVYPFEDWPELSARSGLATLMAFRAHLFVREGAPLPALTRLLPDTRKSSLETAVSCALGFLTLHEMAHFELGHLTPGTNAERPLIGELFVQEQLSDFQREEMEADRFAIDALTPEGRRMAPNLIQAALFPFLFLEPFAGQKSDTHPLSLNRVAAILANASDSNASGRYDEKRGHLDRYRAFQSTRAQLSIPQAASLSGKLTAERLDFALTQLRPLLLPLGIDIDQALPRPSESRPQSASTPR